MRYETVPELIQDFKRYSGTAIIHNGEEQSYDDVYRDIVSIATVLTNKGNTSDSPVIILSSNKYYTILGIYASIYAGRVAVPMDVESSDDEIKRAIDVTESEFLLTTNTGFDYSQVDIIDLDPTDIPETPYDPPNPSEDATALVLFTSGTTGAKKGVLLSHRNLMRTSDYINEFMGVNEPLREHVLVPIHHSFGFARTRCVFSTGGTIVLDDGQLNPLLAFKRLKNLGCNAFSGVPAIMAMLIKAGEDRFETISDEIRYVEIGSAPMARDNKEFLISHLPNANICMHYGLTEASRTCFIDFRKEMDKLDSVGHPSPSVSVEITDENNSEVSTGEVGEITIQGPNVAKGYVSNSVKQEDAEIGDWFETGDMGYADEDGYIYFQGREDDVINIGGEKISVLKIDDAIRETSVAPREYCVVGISDPDGVYGNIPVLCVVDDGFSDEQFQQLKNELSDRGLKEIFHPRLMFNIDHLPQTQNGKVVRPEVRKKIKSDL